MAEFSCTTHTSPDTAVIHAAGDIDLGSADRLWAQISAHLVPGVQVILDCSAVTFCDSTGLQVFMRAHKHAGGSGGFVLAVVEGPIARVLKLTGLIGQIPTGACHCSCPGQPADRTAGCHAGPEPRA